MTVKEGLFIKKIKIIDKRSDNGMYTVGLYISRVYNSLSNNYSSRLSTSIIYFSKSSFRDFFFFSKSKKASLRTMVQNHQFSIYTTINRDPFRPWESHSQALRLAHNQKRYVEPKKKLSCGHTKPPKIIMHYHRVEAFLVGETPNGPPNEVSLVFGGEPIAQQRNRTRVLWKQRRVVVYDPNKRVKAQLKAAIKRALVGVGVNTFPLFPEEKVAFKCTFYVGRNNKDTDNMMKFIMDCLSKVVYHDDLQVFDISAKKVQAEMMVKTVGNVKIKN